MSKNPSPSTDQAARGKRQPPCWWCSKPLSNPFGKPIKGVERKVDGNTVRMHKTCSTDFDIETRRVTAQPRMTATPSPYDCGGNPMRYFPDD